MDNDRAFWLSVRQAVIMILGAIESRLGMERSIVPKRKRSALVGMKPGDDPIKHALKIHALNEEDENRGVVLEEQPPTFKRITKNNTEDE